MGIPILDITLFECRNHTVCTDDTTGKKNDVSLLIVEIAIILFFYLLQLLFLCYNTYAFLINQMRYKIFHLTFFYALSFIIVFCRIVFFALILKFLSQHTEGEDVPQEIDIIDNFAIFFELALGIQQFFSIVELRLMLYYSWLFKTNIIYDA